MTRVALVVTGRLEFSGLAPALKSLFPTADFFIAPSLEEEDLRDSTSTLVDPERNARDTENGDEIVIDSLTAHLAGSLCGREHADLAVFIEDLELVNRGNEPRVLQAVRESVQRHTRRVAQRRGAPRDLDARLRERASFHLFDPMVEAYFYDDPAALDAAAGRAMGHPPGRVAGVDPERFLVETIADPDYFAAVGECELHKRPKDRKCPWGGDHRAGHPKKYLKYLCRKAPPHHFCSDYKETVGGVAALRRLAWSTVLSTPGSAPFLRALIEDLEDALDLRPQDIDGWPTTPSSTAPTARAMAPRERTLRNLLLSLRRCRSPSRSRRRRRTTTRSRRSPPGRRCSRRR